MWDYRGQKRPPFAEQPGPGQESVWDYPRPPALEPAPRTARVMAGAQVLAESGRALRVLETASPPTYYLPDQDVDRTALVPVAGRSFCEWKGVASYWALADAPDQAVAWNYAEPAGRFAALRGHFGFYPARVACFLDAERVRPQPGGFYAGWLTADIAGPVKGVAGTAHW